MCKVKFTLFFICTDSKQKTIEFISFTTGSSALMVSMMNKMKWFVAALETWLEFGTLFGT
jgi:hypothetical protein